MWGLSRLGQPFCVTGAKGRMERKFITAENLTHRFIRRDEEGEAIGEIPALSGIDLSVAPGQFIAIVGPNGSGKSTFARHINALLTPTEGTLFVDGKDAADPDAVWEIRRAAGMVFQNPDNQIVAGIVEEDTAFGPENLGLPTEEIERRVERSLAAVDMEPYRHHTPDALSGGQKQRVAVAGVVAMQPECILLDEATAMLDPDGRREVRETVRRFNRENGVTVLWITHFMEEITEADYVYVLDEGRVALSGTPREVFARGEELRRHGLVLPRIAQLADALRADGLPLPEGILTGEELADALCDGILTPEANDGRVCERREAEEALLIEEDRRSGTEEKERKEKLRIDHVSYTYAPGTAHATQALRDVNLTVREGEMLGLIGATGSGKSTLIQLMNGLLKPDTGHVFYEGRDIHASDPRAEGLSLRELRTRVGLVFQFAESQLFEATVLRDAAYGPKNQGCGEDEALERAREALRRMQLAEEDWEKSPFELSGGQRRRAAIAGVLAMRPEVLILDEPTAGLDPRGREDLFSLLRALHEETGLTVVIVSHSMEEIADLCDRVAVLRGGERLLDGTTEEVFRHEQELKEAHLAVPEVTCLMETLRRRGCPVGTALTVDAAKREIEGLC